MHDVTIGQISFTKRLGVTIEEVKIGAPVPRKTEITIPFRNSTVDMDDVLGTKTYDDRTITVKFWKRCTSLKEVHKKYDGYGKVAFKYQYKTFFYGFYGCCGG